MTKKELTSLARQRGVKGYRTMTKAQLESALGLDTMEFRGEIAPEEETTAKKAEKPAAAPAEDETRAPETAAAEASSTEEAPSSKTEESEADETERTLVVAKPEAEEAEAEETEAEAETAEATELEPKAPPLKQTWTNHELLIDDELKELPGGYNRDRLVLLVRDPFWIYAYWDLSMESVARARQEGGERLVLRVNDVTDILFDGHNAHFSYDIPMPYDGQRMWYVNVPQDGRTYMVQVGYLRADNRFIPLLNSNPGAVPSSRLSEVVADRFIALDYQEPIAEAYSHATGTAPTAAPSQGAAPVGQAPAGAAPAPGETRPAQLSEEMYQLSLRGTPYWSADIPKFGDYLTRPVSSASLSSWALPSSAEFAPKQPPAAKTKDFWLVADCELIVYGATEPDAKVTVRGQAIQLRPDGSFTLRFALPNGNHPIPIHAVNADEDMERSITITVTRDTVSSH